MYHQVYLLVDGDGGVLHPAQHHVLPTSGTGNWEDGDPPAPSFVNLGETYRMTQITINLLATIYSSNRLGTRNNLATCTET